jgi:protein-L-isoaspartate(D-aspartate) O-methyltransferase
VVVSPATLDEEGTLMIDLAAVRAWYAQELRYAAAVKSPAIVQAFATVPRERFLGPGPWQISTGDAPNKYWSTEDDDPRCVYHNVVIGMLTEKGLNNGQPSLWAYLFDRLNLTPGKRVLHLGCGAGYYSAVLAEIVGSSGAVGAMDLEEPLIARARCALTSWPHVTVSQGDAAAYVPAEVDIIVASAGATHPMPQWIDALPPGGQLLLPLTGERGWGQTLLVTRPTHGRGFAAQLVGYVGIYAFAGARDGGNAKRIDAAVRRGDMGAVKSLRRDAHDEDGTCWLHADGWCLSRQAI